MRGRGKGIFATAMLALAVLAGTIGASWTNVGVWIAPRTVLYYALKDTIDGLRIRWDDHPVALIMPLLNQQGLYSADGEVDFPGFSFTGRLNLDLSRRSLMADGNVSAGSEKNAVSLFLNSKKASVCFPELDPNYYGISYDSFRRDLEEIPLLSYFLDKQLFAQWETKVNTLENTMESMITMPSLPVFPEGWEEALRKAVLFLPVQMEKAECPVDGCIFCRKIIYTLGEESLDVLRKAGVPLENGLHALRLDFVVHKNALIQMDAEAHRGGGIQKLTLKMTGEDSGGIIEVSCSDNDQGPNRGFSAVISSCPGKDHLTESWNICRYREGEERKCSFAYQWFPQSGDLFLKNVAGADIRCVLKSAEDCLFFACEDLRMLKSVIFSVEDPLKMPSVTCKLTIRKGSVIREPEYKPLREWTLEEFASILTILIPMFG